MPEFIFFESVIKWELYRKVTMDMRIQSNQWIHFLESLRALGKLMG